MSVTQESPGSQTDPRAIPLSAETPLGVHPLDCHTALQTDVFKELVNKISWVLGSTYRAPYANIRTEARQYAVRIATRVLKDHGYPGKIAK